MQSTLNISIQQSGQPVSIPNTLRVASGSALNLTYVVNGAPNSLTITVMGLKNAAGESPVLDTYVGTANTPRTVNLTDTYDYFLITAVWTGGTSSVNVDVTLSVTGSGNVFQGAFQFVQSGIGSPAGVLAAPVGTLYVNLSGGSGTTLYVKESGANTTSGWVGK